MNYVTTADRVVVEPDPDHETTAAGFIIAYDDTPTHLGTVILNILLFPKRNPICMCVSL